MTSLAFVHTFNPSQITQSVPSQITQSVDPIHGLYLTLNKWTHADTAGVFCAVGPRPGVSHAIPYQPDRAAPPIYAQYIELGGGIRFGSTPAWHRGQMRYPTGTGALPVPVREIVMTVIL